MMNNLLRVGLLALVSTTALVACGAQDLDGGSRQSVFVRGALAPPVMRTNDACVFNDKDAAMLFEGTVDFGLADEYKLTLLLQTTDGAASTSISGARVAVRSGEELVREFTTVTSGFVDAGRTALVSLTAIDPVTKDMVLQNPPGLPNRSALRTLTLEVTLTGREPSTGHDVETPVFRFPVKACKGCLVDFSKGNDPLQPSQPNCSKPLPMTAPATKPCYFGQDEPVACQLCIGSFEACDPKMP